MTTPSAPATRSEIRHLLDRVHAMSPDLAADAAAAVDGGAPLSDDQLVRLLEGILKRLRDTAEELDDDVMRSSLARDTELLIGRIVAGRGGGRSSSVHGNGPPTPMDGSSRRVILQGHDGSPSSPVKPTPVFHGRSVPMVAGLVDTRDIDLWPENVRLEIHLHQFERQEGRPPTSEELLDIMLSRAPLPGIREDNQFKIPELARSIAQNGVQRPPIIGPDGTLYDGNRRVSACLYILNSDEFDLEQKRRAERIPVWQLTEHADEDDIDAVVVALNFEPDHKKEWPTYVKARKVADEWQTVLALEPNMTPQRMAERKRELSQRFALGPNTTAVNRWLRMVDWVREFEDHHIQARHHDPYETQHQAAERFEYFDELSKGSKPGGVAWTLNQHDEFKSLVFDLLYEGKFRNWGQVRKLKHVPQDREAFEAMRKAREAEDLEEAETHLDHALTLASQAQAEARELGVNTRISRFVTWLEELPVRTFRDKVDPENLKRLLDALRLVESHAAHDRTRIAAEEDADA